MFSWLRVCASKKTVGMVERERGGERREREERGSWGGGLYRIHSR